MEFERLISAGGPTEGHLIRPTDRRTPQRIGFVQCVGSRSLDGRGNPYCSNICCMNTVKDSLLLKDHYPDTDTRFWHSPPLTLLIIVWLGIFHRPDISPAEAVLTLELTCCPTFRLGNAIRSRTEDA